MDKIKKVDRLSKKRKAKRQNKSSTPYMRVEYLSGDTREVIEFDGDGTLRGASWQDCPRRSSMQLRWILLITGYLVLIVAVIRWGW